MAKNKKKSGSRKRANSGSGSGSGGEQIPKTVGVASRANKRKEMLDGTHPEEWIPEEAKEGRTAEGEGFEDLVGDDFIEEELVMEGVRVVPDESGGAGPSSMASSSTTTTTTTTTTGKSVSFGGAITNDTGGPAGTVWRPEMGMGPDEAMDYDESVYKLFHSMSLEWPALSIDVVRDTLGYKRTRFPHTLYAAAGTQAEDQSRNGIVVLKLSQLARNGHGEQEDEYDDEEGSEDDDDEGNDEYMDPIVEYKTIPFEGCVNRIRSMPQAPATLAAWSDTGNVHIYDLVHHVSALDEPPPLPLESRPAPIHSFVGHTTEGFALDWSPTTPGALLSGDCGGAIHAWRPNESGWTVDIAPYVGHESSVEDLQWSPNQASVFASCGVDGTVKIWDLRKKGGPALSRVAHSMDANVISWSSLVEFLIVSGGDDGSFAIWDLRYFENGDPGYEQRFDYHTGPITSVDWHPTEASSLAVASEDNQITLWDLGVEADDEELQNDAELLVNTPPQLLFVHQGLSEVKEVKWHPQIPGVVVATGAEGLNVFRPINF